MAYIYTLGKCTTSVQSLGSNHRPSQEENDVSKCLEEILVITVIIVHLQSHTRRKVLGTRPRVPNVCLKKEERKIKNKYSIPSMAGKSMSLDQTPSLPKQPLFIRCI